MKKRRAILIPYALLILCICHGCNPAYAELEEETDTTITAAEETEATEPTEQTEPPPPPLTISPVLHLSYSHVKANSANLHWDKVMYASGYEVYKWSKKKQKWRLIKTTTNTYTKVKKLHCNRTYKFKVRAYGYDGDQKVYGGYDKVKFKTKLCPRHKLIKKAKSKLGCSYGYGCSGPNRFDCSGFVYWTYKNAKVKKKFSRGSCNSIYKQLKGYKVKKPKIGDIVLYKNSSYTHAAIYAGGGKIIHAARPGKGVCKQKMTTCHGTRTYIRILR